MKKTMIRETILCSAIKRDNGKLVLCRRHGDGIWLKMQLYGETTTQEQQGFYTDRGNFVNRKEAFNIAKREGLLKVVNQIDGELIDYSNEDILYSEYVW